MESRTVLDVAGPSLDGLRTADALSREEREGLRAMLPPESGGVSDRLMRAGDPPLVEVVDSPNNTRPFAGLFLSAAEQTVGAGCLSGGTASTQMRHIPAGGL